MAYLGRFLARGLSPSSVLIRCSPLLSRQLIPTSQNAVNTAERRVHMTAMRPQQTASADHHPHARHWVLERAAALGLYAVIPAAYLVEPCFAMDTALSLSLVVHAHWGIAAIFQDYMHGYPSITGERRYPILTTMAKILPIFLSITAFACLLNFNYNDVGLVKAIAMLWRV